MKKLIFYSISFIALIFSSENVFSQDKIIAQKDLPMEIQNYLSTHFKEYNIIKAKEDNEKKSMKYKVTLNNNTKLEFNSSNKIIEIDSKSKLPESVIPAAISSYVKANYPTNHITDWEIEGENQQVELNNGLELEFNMKGDFLRIDR